MNSEEERLVSACVKHDQRACKALYERFSNKMFGLCLRYCHSRQDAQDLLHDGFIKVFENLSDLTQDSHLESWIRKVMINTVISHHRSNAIREFKSIEDVPDEMELSICDYDRYDIECIMNAIQRLPDNYRLVFNLHEIEGYTYEELAHLLGISNSGVRSLCFRAKNRLATMLTEFDD